MSEFKIIDGEMYAIMTEDEHSFITTWMEEHKDDLAVQEIIYLGEELERDFKAMRARRAS